MPTSAPAIAARSLATAADPELDLRAIAEPLPGARALPHDLALLLGRLDVAHVADLAVPLLDRGPRLRQLLPDHVRHETRWLEDRAAAAAQRLAGVQTAAGGDLAVQRAERVDTAEDPCLEFRDREGRVRGLDQRGHSGDVWSRHRGAADRVVVLARGPQAAQGKVVHVTAVPDGAVAVRDQAQGRV